MISHSHKFIFIHVPKAAGNSVQEILKQYSVDVIKEIHEKDEQVVQNFYVRNPELKTTKHSPLRHYYNNWNSDVGDIGEYLKFGNIRNPWDRAVSYYFFKSKNESFDKQDFLKNLICAPMFNYFAIKGSLEQIDHFIRFENIQEDFDLVCDKIGISRYKLPHLNRTIHRHYSEYYDEEMIEIVREKYKKDIDNFGYEFGDS